MARELFSAVLEPSASDRSWGVSFPSFPGCVSYGANEREAQLNGAEALALHIEGMIEDGDPIPTETDVHTAGPVKAPQRAVFIAIDVPDRQSERVNVYLPKRLIDSVDRYAAASGANRSGVIGVALRQYLAREAQPRAQGAGKQG